MPIWQLTRELRLTCKGCGELTDSVLGRKSMESAVSFGRIDVKRDLVRRRRYRPFVDVRKISMSKTRDKLVAVFFK